MKYEVYVMKEATYTIEAESEEDALNIADAWLMEQDFDECDVEEIN